MNLQQSDADKELAKKYLEKHELLVSNRKTWETHWQECLNYIVPRKNDITVQHTPGTKRGNQLFDTTAIMANNQLSAELHSMLTNPTVRFFDLAMEDPKDEDDDMVKEWLADTADKMFKVLNNSNFQTEVHEIYIDEGAIGTACLYMGEHPEKILHFSARSMREIYIDENNLGMIDTVHREFKWKLRQIVQEFGEAAMPPDLLKLFKDGDDRQWDIVHCTHPMSDEDKVKLGAFEFSSVYLLKEQKYILSKKNYHESPYCVPRWTKTSGEIYGRGPGMDMLADIRMVNRMMETVLKGAQKTVDPPLMVADDGVIGQVKLTPGGLTVVRPYSGNDVPIKPLIIDARIDFGQKVVEDVRQRIRSGFYVDQWQYQQGPQKTATEVNSLNEQRLQLMGPVLGRQHFEFLTPLIGRLFGAMSRKKGMLKDAPASIRGKKFSPRYSSLIARAQRMSEGQNVARALAVAEPILNVSPSSVDVMNGDETIKYIFDVYGVPQKLLHNARDLKNIRDAKAAQMKDQMQQQQQAHQADVASKVLPGVAQLKSAQAQSAQG